MTTRQFLASAIAEARRARVASLPVLFQKAGGEINDHQRATCPFCHTTDSLLFSHEDERGWRACCDQDDCDASRLIDEVDYLAMSENLTERQAIRKLLDIAGLSHLWGEPDTDCTPEPEPGTMEARIPHYITPSKLDANPYGAAWKLLELTDEHRKELHTKRAMPDPWIEAFGLRSAVPENRERLKPVLSMFEPRKLLQSGVAVRTAKGDLRIADSLCGRQFDKSSNKWVTQPTIIIPYIDAVGAITLLRPHKRSLSNSAWRDKEESSGFYQKLYNNLRMPYGEHILHAPRSDEWRHTAILSEGEFKAMALAMCGIPSIAFQGIHFFKQGERYKQAVESTSTLLRCAEIRAVITVFDSEDKSHKPTQEQFEAETYARFTAERLEDSGFSSMYGVLPDDWREGGKKVKNRTIGAKADWDSRLAYHVRKQKGNFEAGHRSAGDEFRAFLNRRGYDDSPVRRSPRQVDFFPDLKEDIIQQNLHRLRHVREIFEGGEKELELANEIQNWCHPDYHHRLKIDRLADDLRATVGGYYTVKNPSEALEKRTIEALDKIGERLDEAEVDGDEETLRRLRAAKQACYTILYRYPDPFTDFTAISRYKIRAFDEKGEPRLDRLVTFVDRNGRKSKPFQMPADRMASSQELRKFFLSMGSFHWRGNQDKCDKWVQHLDVMNYQKDIEAIDTYGWNEDHRLYLFMDCAIADAKDPEQPGTFIFPKKNGILWHNGKGFKNSDEMASFSHTPPSLFPDCKGDLRDHFNTIDWDEEKAAGREIWRNMITDMKDSLGGYAGYVLVAGILQYLAHPEALKIMGKPSLVIQGEKGSGKTRTAGFGMALVGFNSYQPISLGSTKVGIERALTRFRGLPLHIDEWRNIKVDARMLDLFIAAFNELAQHKGTPQGGKQTRSMAPLTPGLITGEDSPIDAALRSRYMRIVASPSYSTDIPENETEAERKKRKDLEETERVKRFDRMLISSQQYHRIGRILIRERRKFSAIALEQMNKFKSAPGIISQIHSSRARENAGLFIGAIRAAMQILWGKESFEHGEGDDFIKFTEWMIQHCREANDEIESDVFRTKFFSDCVHLINRSPQSNIDKYLRVIRGSVDESRKVTPIPGYTTQAGRLLVIVRPGELFDEYQRDRRLIEGAGSPISRNNILAELKNQPYWIKPPKAERQHRFQLPNDGSRAGLWVMDYLRMDPEMRQIFQPIYQAELARENLKLDSDDINVIASDGTPSFRL